MGRAWRLSQHPGEARCPVQREAGRAAEVTGSCSCLTQMRVCWGRTKGAVSALVRALQARPCASCAPSRFICRGLHPVPHSVTVWRWAFVN